MTPAAPERVAVLGAGTMGSGIAVAFALAGSAVGLTARREPSLAAARERIAQSFALLVEAGVVTAAAADDGSARIATTTELESAAEGAELVVESIVEDLDAKRQVLVRAERAAPEALLGTDTSSLSIDALAEPLARPERLAGFHWFNPPELVPLVEVVAGTRTAATTAERLLAWARAVGKRPVLVRRDIEGFLANRLQYALLREAFALVEAGVCTYADVDEAMRSGLGARWAAVGPFETLDLAGLDVHEAVAQRLFPLLTSSTEPAAAVTRLVAEGSLGCKSGRGLYGDYDADDIGRLGRRRAEVLLALARLRDGAEPSARPA